MSFTLEIEQPLPFPAAAAGAPPPAADPRYPDDGVIRRYRARSGLAVILLCDHAAEIVSYQTWFRVGSRHERIGHTGIAHLFEHLMFNRTESGAAGDFDRLVESTGGDSNAATWTDWTHYRTSLPASELELAVRLEADRMSHLCLDPEVLEAEREVVLNERRERVDNDVDGFLDEQLMAAAFTRHPYRHPTIGWERDIRGLDRAEILEFYDRYYVPNNATIVLVGHFDPAHALELVERYYGAIEPAAVPEVDTAIEPEPHGERRRIFSRPVAAERLAVGYPAPSQRHPDWACLELINYLLAGSPSARLHRRLVVDAPIATTVYGSVTPFRDPGLLELAVNLRRDQPATAALHHIDQVMDQLRAAPVDDAELAKAKNLAETELWSELDSCDGKAEALGHFETTGGDFRQLFTVADRLGAVTADDITRVAQRYLGRRQRTAVVVAPSGDDPDRERDR